MQMTMNNQIFSQRDPKWMDKPLPNASDKNYITIKNFGCLLTCLANFAQVAPDKIMESHPNLFRSNGMMMTADLYGAYGFKVIEEKRKDLPKSDKMYIAVTDFFKKYNKDWGTHFFLVKPDGSIIDPASAYNPKAINRYKNNIIAVRYVEKM
jgi:hypothetical protein